MASGFKELLFNLDERVVSPDHNRAQKFKGADIAEMMRLMMNVSTATDDLDAGGVTTEYATVESPLRAEIANGFLVRPAVGSLSLAIDDGVLFALDPDSAADDSNYKYVRDPGVTAGGLLMTANASGSTRVDVIECQPTPLNLESATRDVYNPSTSTFSPTLVTKAVGDNMTYRVRMGTAGAGWPGTASGWLPLCVAIVPTSTTVNDTITFYDVRRLINDRAYGVFNLQQSNPVVRKANAYGNSATGLRLAGFLENEYNGHRIGGNILRGSPGTDNAYLDLSDSQNQAQGYAAPANGYAWLYLLFPLGLPRWARYTDSSYGSRVPRSPRGIPILSATGPQHVTGKPTSAIQLPTAWGLGTVTVTDGLCVGAVQYVSSAYKDVLIADGFQWVPVGPPTPVNATGATINGATFTFTENTHFPAHAKSVLVQLDLVVSMASAGNIVCYPQVQITGPSGSASAIRPGETKVIAANAGANLYTIQVCVEVPIPSRWPSTTPGTLTVVLTTNITSYAGSNTLSGTPTGLIQGWRY